MVFQVLPSSGPLRLTAGQTSPPLDLFVPDEVEQTFVRFVVLYRDGDPLGGEAPTFQVRPERGLFASLPVDGTEVRVPRSLSGSPVVATAQCSRDDDDIYLLALTAIAEGVRRWKLRIRNNDAEPLRLLGFNSPTVEDTFQPFMRLGDPDTAFVSSHFEIVGTARQSIAVRNWGTTTLQFTDEPGPIGDPNSNLILQSLPSEIEPHGVGRIVVASTAPPDREDVALQLETNDAIRDHGTLTFELIPSQRDPGPEPTDYPAENHPSNPAS